MAVSPRLSTVIEAQARGPEVELKVNPTAILEVAAGAFAAEEPVEFEWFLQRERAGGGQTNGIVLALVQQRLHEHGWALAQLFYDQTLKASALNGARMNLAHPAFGVAQAALAIGHSAAVRYYATIAQLADVLGEPHGYRAGAAIFLSNRVGWSPTEKLIEEAETNAAQWNTETARTGVSWPEPNRQVEPVYPEALLVAHWFPSHTDLLLKHAIANKRVPFVELLLGEARRAVAEDRAAESGTLFEAAAALLLATTPGFEVRGGYKDASSQTDIVVMYRRDPFCDAFLPEGYALVECKYWDKAVGAHVIREFGARCLLQDIHLGVLVTRKGIAGENQVALRDAELERRRLMARGVHILVLAKDDIAGKVHELRGLEGVLKEDLERLRFGERT